jgi:nucleotide-binding universal stress UspA family protein
MRAAPDKRRDHPDESPTPRWRFHPRRSGATAGEAETSGHAASEIVDTAEDEDFDLVVLAGRKRSATGKFLFGSTSQEVLLDLHGPVLVCETGAED